MARRLRFCADRLGFPELDFHAAIPRPGRSVAGGRLRGPVSGVKTGEEIVTSGVFKLRNGAAVQVNNTIQPSNNPTPRVEDR